MRRRNPPQPGRKLGMPLTAWPQTDQHAWRAAFEPADPFDDRVDHSHLRQPTRDKHIATYARWLRWLQDHHPDAMALPAAQRTTEDAVIAYLTALNEEISPKAVADYAAGLRSALKIIDPATDWEWLKPFIGRLQRRAQDAPKVRRPFVPIGELYAYGIELMRMAEADPDLMPIDAAVLFRDGLSIAFLAARPLRMLNMMNLEIGPNLRKTHDGFAVDVPHTKTHVALAFPLPETLVPFMTSYLARHRPFLAAGPYGVDAGYPEHAKFLWLAVSGAQFPRDSFADMITHRVQERFQLRLTPHDFRRCAATSIAEYAPEEYHIIRAILGHSTSATADKYYIKAKGIDASRKVQGAIIKRRNALKDR